MSHLALRWLCFVALALAAPAATLAQSAATSPLQGADLLAALRAGGYVIYFRHADTDHRQNDQRMTSVDDCTTQRNLTDRGREHARAIGEAIARGTDSGRRRPGEPTVPHHGDRSARLRLRGEVAGVREGGPPPPGSPGRFAALRALLSTPVATGANTVVVGHAYPYYTLVGGQYLSEGEAHVLRPRGADFEVVARVSLTQWRSLF